MKKIFLVAPRTQKKSGADINPIKTPLTGLLTIASYLDEKGYDVEFYDELIQKPDYDKIDPGFLLISCMSATVERGYKIADYFSEKDTEVIMGGLHVSFKPEEALEHCDKVVVGEGEKKIIEVIEGKTQSDIIEGQKIRDLDEVPLPDYDLVKGVDNPKKAALSTSRGCPKRCSFCSLQQLFGPEIRSVSNERVIEHLNQYSDLKTLCFDEPNFISDIDRAIELLKLMKEYGINPQRTWVSVSLDVAEEEKFLKLCSDVSDFNFTIGLESINPKVSRSYSNSKSFSKQKMKNSIKKIQDYGIKIEGSFVFGSNRDKKDVFEKTLEFCKETEIEFPAFFPLTPYPGTEIRDKMKKENRVFTNNWNYYDNLHTVFEPKNMTPYELQKGIIDCYKEFYNLKKSLNHFLNKQFFYGGVTLYLKYLFWKMIRQNKEYLNKLKEIS